MRPLAAFLLDRHVARCGDCRDTLASFTELRSSAELRGLTPEYARSGLESLAGEMRANIRLGLAAGECVARDPPRFCLVRGSRVWRWVRLACSAAGGRGFFLHGLLPHDNRGGRSARGNGANRPVPESQVRTGTGSMTLLNHARRERAIRRSPRDGAIRASYVDGDTGTVTVTSVYVE